MLYSLLTKDIIKYLDIDETSKIMRKSKSKLKNTL